MCCSIETYRIELYSIVIVYYLFDNPFYADENIQLTKFIFVYIIHIMDYSLNISKWILLIIILSILGLNIFNYLARITEVGGDVVKSGVSVGLEGTRKTIDLSGKGASSIAGALERGIGDLEKALDIEVVDNSIPSSETINGVQLPKKSGYCYIGTDKGYRNCVYVGRNENCMSGEIFPTIDVCINPKLRV